MQRLLVLFFFFADTATTEIYTLSLHDALPISPSCAGLAPVRWSRCGVASTICRCRSRSLSGSATSASRASAPRSEEHTSELQSPYDLVCRLLLEKKK